MLLPMLVASFAAMLVPTLLRNVPLYESLREHMLRGERFGVSKIEGVSSARLTLRQ
jgi:CIC family chloride channel protein